MGLLFLYWGMILAGYFTGSKTRKIKEKLFFIGTLLFTAVIVLVFIMGARMGSNKEVISNLHTIGLDALLMTVFILAGSIIAVIITRKFLGVDKNGMVKSLERYSNEANINSAEAYDDTVLKNNGGGASSNGNANTLFINNGDSYDDTAFVNNVGNAPTCEKGQPKGKDDSGKKMTITILASVASGIIFGYLFIPKLFSDYSSFDVISGNSLVVGLCILLFCVGVDLGLSGTIASSLRSAGFRVLIFPFSVVIGTLAGALICGLILPITQKEALAIGAGFGWYTLAPILITEQGHAIAGAISFIHNVMRELGGIVLIPIVAGKIGCIEAASMPGVASMDVCIPLIERACGERIVIYSFLIGLLQSAAVPLLVPLFLGL